VLRALGLGLVQIAHQGIRVTEHPGLTDAGDALVGVDLDIGEIAPGSPDDLRADSRDAQGKRLEC
jgi:hypothetical protein